MKRKTQWPMMAALALALAATAAFAGEPSEADMYQSWQTISVEGLKQACDMGTAVMDQRYRLVGEVKTVSTPNPSLGSYYFIQGSEGERFPVKNSSDRRMAEDMVFLTATLQTASDGTLYLNEAYVWRFYTPGDAAYLKITTPTTEELRTWRDNGGYDYAVENAYRRFFIKARNGNTLQEISIGNWVNRGVRTTVLEIENFLKNNQVQAPQQGPERENVSEGPIVIQTTPVTPPPKTLQELLMENLALIVAALVVLVLLIVVVVLLTRKGSSSQQPVVVPGPAPVVGTTPPPLPQQPQQPQEEKTVVLLNGTELDASDKTVALSDYALKVVKGGKSVGKLLYLTASDAVLGRGSSTSGTFIHLDMSDRPELAKHCSREYAKITPQYGNDTLDVEVVNTSHNKVVVDGRVLLNKGDMAQAKVGSHIILNPDWEFEVVNRN